MEHRHIVSSEWTLQAVASALSRGDLPDWRELFAAVRAHRSVARRVIHLTHHDDFDNASPLARALTLRLWPDLKDEPKRSSYSDTP